eukprot:6949766-Karenia_brevis.AAC.1
MQRLCRLVHGSEVKCNCKGIVHEDKCVLRKHYFAEERWRACDKIIEAESDYLTAMKPMPRWRARAQGGKFREYR